MKLPLFARVKWTECAGSIIESGQRPRFVDFLQFLKQVQVHAMIEALNTKARNGRMVQSKVVLSVPTSMVFGGVVNLKVYPIRTR